MERRRVLVVDDDRFIRRAVRHLVECLGHECLEVGTGDEACNVALAERPDLIVLDVMLPGMNGYEVSRMIKQEVQNGNLGKNIPILIVTARRTDTEEREEFLQIWSHADEFIYKPFDLEYLGDRITSFLQAEESCAESPSEEREQEPTAGAEVSDVEEVRTGD